MSATTTLHEYRTIAESHADRDLVRDLPAQMFTELKTEVNDGLTKVLYWDSVRDRCWVYVHDAKNLMLDSMFPVPEGTSANYVFTHACSLI